MVRRIAIGIKNGRIKGRALLRIAAAGCAAPALLSNMAPPAATPASMAPALIVPTFLMPVMTTMMVTPTFSYRCPNGNLIEATPQSNNGLKVAVVEGPDRSRLAPRILKARPRPARATKTRFAGGDGKFDFVLPDRPDRDAAEMIVNGQKPQLCRPDPGIRD